MLRHCEHVVDQLNIAGALRDVSTPKHPLLNRNQYFRWEHTKLIQRLCTVHKAGHVVRRHTVDGAADSNDLASVDAGVDRGP